MFSKNEGAEVMFDIDGDGDIDQFDDELYEYELQLFEDEMIFEEMERGEYQTSSHEEEPEKSGRQIIVIPILLLVFLLIFFWILAT